MITKYKNRLSTFLHSSWAILPILGIAIFLRFWKIAEWSLWEDEETTIYFSQNLNKPFPSAFPIFFVALNWLFRFTGTAAEAGRLLAAIMGVLGVWLLYICVRRLFSRKTALFAALLLTVNIGHLFWSQSIRYFTTVLCFQLLSIIWFHRGLESGKHRFWFLSISAFVFAILTHYSALLLAPVFVVYLILIMWQQKTEERHNPPSRFRHKKFAGMTAPNEFSFKPYLLYGLTLALVLGLFVPGILQQLSIQGALDSGGVIASARSPFKFLLRVIAYFGMPAVGIGLFAPFIHRQEFGKPAARFFLILSVLPMLGLMVITLINTTVDFVSVTWYYGFVSFIGFSVLSAHCLITMFETGNQTLARILSTGTLLYYLVFLVGYYTTMHGDRPRWRDASQFILTKASFEMQPENKANIFATVPGVVAYYLGVEPAKTMGHPLVRRIPKIPPETAVENEQWYIVKAHQISPQWGHWFARNCTLEAKFEAMSGPRDRALLIYHYDKSP
jgi:hypothetical protein